MHPYRPSARAGLLAAAAALVVMLVAVPMASAATFSGGSLKLSFKITGTKVSSTGGAPKSSTGGTFRFAENAGTATMNKQASGSLNVLSSTSITLTRGKKKIVLKSLVQKLTAGKGQLTAKINGKGKAIAFFDEASANKVNASSDFTQLTMGSVSLTLTKAGAAALNKAFGLKGTSVLKAKAKAGTVSFTADRSLTVVGGSTQTVYDVPFVNKLRECAIELSAVAPATAIPKDPNSAPEGGANLPINPQSGGTLSGKALIGSVFHQGGTQLDRPAPGQPGNNTDKSEYHSPLTNFTFGLQGGAKHSLTATLVVANNTTTNIGDVVGTAVPNLSDTGGSVSLAGELVLSEAASSTLSQKPTPGAQGPQLGADCPIPAGSKIGAITMVANVE